MVISAAHTVSTRANLRQAHERQLERVLWEEEHGYCRTCDCDKNPNPQARCNGCINGGGKFDLYKRKQKKKVHGRPLEKSDEFLLILTRNCVFDTTNIFSQKTI